MNEHKLQRLQAMQLTASKSDCETLSDAIFSLKKQERYEALRKTAAVLVEADRAQALTTELVDRVAAAVTALEDE